MFTFLIQALLKNTKLCRTIPVASRLTAVLSKRTIPVASRLTAVLSKRTISVASTLTAVLSKRTIPVASTLTAVLSKRINLFLINGICFHVHLLQVVL
jgi:hypothetical protein